MWQERCKLLQLPGEDFRTLKLKRQRSRREERALATEPSCTGARCLHSLPSVMARELRHTRHGQPNTSSRLPRNWLLPGMLDQGVTPAHGDGRLGCFLRACAPRPVVVAALGGFAALFERTVLVAPQAQWEAAARRWGPTGVGPILGSQNPGSVTSGLAYRVLSAKDQGGEEFAHLYHRHLARWLRARWPATQSRATELNHSINLGVPGTGPALTALCLTSMQVIVAVTVWNRDCNRME